MNKVIRDTTLTSLDPAPSAPPVDEDRTRPSERAIGGVVLRSAKDLRDAGLVPAEAVKALSAVAARYAVAITPDMASLIEAEPVRGALAAGGQPATGPIAAQFIPDIRELTSTPEELLDPIGDEAHSPVKG